MKIEKRTKCTIALFDEDAISGVCVDGSIEKDDLLGTIIIGDRSNPKVSYVCSKLVVQGGTVKNITVRNGGVITIDSGIIDSVHVESRGEIIVNGGTVTRIRECGGCVRGPFMKDRGTLVFEPFVHRGYSLEGTVTIHDENVFKDGYGRNASITIFEGSLLNYNIDHSTLTIYRGGTCNDTVLTNYSMICIRGGNVKNVEIKDHSHVSLSPIIDENGEYVDLLEHVENVIVRKDAWIELYYNEGEDVPSTDGLTIEDGVFIHTIFCDDNDVEHTTTKVHYNGELLSVNDYNNLTKEENK